MVRDDIADLGTPLLRLERWAPNRVVFAKLDHLLPSGSCYDRVGFEVPVGQPVVVAGWASFVLSAAAEVMRAGAPCTAIVPDDLTWEHQVLLRGLKLKLHRVPAAELISHARRLSDEQQAILMVEEDAQVAMEQSWRCDWARHQQEIGPEPLLLCGPAGPAFDAWVKAARAEGFDVETLAALGGPERPGQHGSRSASPEASVVVSDEQALEIRGNLARTEGLLIGPNSAAGLYAALHSTTARRAMCLILDAGDRYFSVDPVGEPN